MIRINRLAMEFLQFIKHIFQSRDLLVTLSVNDFRDQYRGAHLGLLWAILRPSIFILTIWLIFSIGFKRGGVEAEYPFIIYLLCGFIPWLFFSESLAGSMNSIVSNGFLVKKVAFRVSVLPLVKLFSSLFLHGVFLTILAIVLFVNGVYPTVYWLQIPFYLLLLMALVLGLGWLTASLRVFTKDVAQVVSVVLQLGFWVTPIFWQFKMVPEKYHYILQLNPMVYIVEGYRNTFLRQIWFWDQTESFTYFFSTTVFFVLTGAMVFKRLRPHFGDVL